MQYQGFTLVLSKKALKQLEKISLKDRILIIKKLDLLLITSETLDIKKLHHQHALYRLRVGDYRIIYQVQEKQKILAVLLVGHRREIYNMLLNMSVNVH